MCNRHNPRPSYYLSMMLVLLIGLMGVPHAQAAQICSSESQIFAVEYLGACGHEQSDKFTLTSAKNVTWVRIWYDTNVAPHGLQATMTGPNGFSLSQATTLGGCYTSWCEGKLIVNSTLPPGTYNVTVNSNSVCMNPSGDSTLVVNGCAAPVVSPPSLTVTKSGTGTVTSVDGSINCGGTCSATYTNATSVTLTAAPGTGFTFDGWDGACSGTGVCNVNVNTTKNVTAAFKPVPFTAVTTGVVAGIITAPIATVTTKVAFNPADVGKPQSVFITAWAPLNTLSSTQQARIASYMLLRAYSKTTTTSFALVQLISSGWQPVVNGQLIPYVSGVLGDQSAAISILDNTDTSKLPGSQFCVGYGTSATEMTAAGRMQLIATIPNQNATKSSSGSCNVAQSISNARVFAYAEANYASLFSGGVSSGQYQQYGYRYYADTQNYLAVDTAGVIFILGPVSNNVVTAVAPVENFRGVITTWEGGP